MHVERERKMLVVSGMIWKTCFQFEWADACAIGSVAICRAHNGVYSRSFFCCCCSLPIQIGRFSTTYILMRSSFPSFVIDTYRDTKNSTKVNIIHKIDKSKSHQQNRNQMLKGDTCNLSHSFAPAMFGCGCILRSCHNIRNAIWKVTFAIAPTECQCIVPAVVVIIWLLLSWCTKLTIRTSARTFYADIHAKQKKRKIERKTVSRGKAQRTTTTTN